MNKRAVLIAGPTASGKSALAIEIAQAQNGVIINADSMQVYDVLNILSARPKGSELALVEHFLYGYVCPEVRHSTGAWFGDVKALMAQAGLQDRLLIFVGGTGLYFKALSDGFIDIPAIPHDVVSRISAEVDLLNREQRRDMLAEKDPLMAARLVEPDSQRLVRALSVLEVTGRSLASWQDEKQVGLLGDYKLERIVLNPDRDLLRTRIAQRFQNMFEGGAVEEVHQLLALGLDPAMPAMKAIGVREIESWIKGEISREKVVELAIIATRQYAKRQRTWFRRSMKDWEWRK